MYNYIGTDIGTDLGPTSIWLGSKPYRRGGIMHGIAIPRIWHGLSTRLWALAGSPFRLLTTQPASPWLPILFYVPMALAALIWNLASGSQPGWAYGILPLAGV